MCRRYFNSCECRYFFFLLLSFSLREDFVKIRRVANLIVFCFFFPSRRNFGYIRPVKFFKYFYIDVTHVDQSRLKFYFLIDRFSFFLSLFSFRFVFRIYNIYFLYILYIYFFNICTFLPFNLNLHRRKIFVSCFRFFSNTSCASITIQRLITKFLRFVRE